MLILTRRVGEKITIGDDIVIAILDVKGRHVRVGIEAPPHTVIHREEVYQRILEENLMASGAEVRDLEHAMKVLGKAVLQEKKH